MAAKLGCGGTVITTARSAPAEITASHFVQAVLATPKGAAKHFLQRLLLRN
jgi:hypothetical protein